MLVKSQRSNTAARVHGHQRSKASMVCIVSGKMYSFFLCVAYQRLIIKQVDDRNANSRALDYVRRKFI